IAPRHGPARGIERIEAHPQNGCVEHPTKNPQPTARTSGVPKRGSIPGAVSRQVTACWGYCRQIERSRGELCGRTKWDVVDLPDSGAISCIEGEESTVIKGAGAASIWHVL